MNALDSLINALRTLPGVSKKAAAKMALHMLQNREDSLHKLQASLTEADAQVKSCTSCGNLDVTDPCQICASDARNNGQICIVPLVSDLWALEKTRLFRGTYQVLGGLLSAINGITPEQLRIHVIEQQLAAQTEIKEVILALPASVEGASTTHHLIEVLQGVLSDHVVYTKLAHGMPMGGHLDTLDEGTLSIALSGRARV